MRKSSFVLGFLVSFATVHAAKREFNVPTEKEIQRRRVTIRQTVMQREPVLDRDDAEFERARRARLDQKTQELISQLENLYKRRGQESRRGEIMMRLAELYYERGEAIAQIESEAWEAQVKNWEALSTEARASRPRPALKTPKADAYRRKALNVYENLERSSRGSRAQSQMIRRDEVLFFLGATLNELGQPKRASVYFEELVNKFPQSERMQGARMMLADYYFDTNAFGKAIPHYLRLATMPNAADSQENLQGYALYKLAWCYMNTGEHGKAILAFRRTLDISRQSKSERRVAFEKEALFDLGRAYAYARNYSEGEEYFKALGSGGTEFLRRFRQNAAEIARDRGEESVALDFYSKLIQMNPDAPEALDYAMERVKLRLRSNNINLYIKEYEELLTNYGATSRWLEKNGGSAENRSNIVADLVGMVRREAKDRHNQAQRRKRPEMFQQARPFYALYLSQVPKQNPDTPENLHEMRFFYAELLYQIGDFKAAANAYLATGEGKYGAVAAYNRILALREASKTEPSLSSELLAASKEFTEKYPKDERSGDILYSSAEQSFKSGSASESLETLRALVEKFPDKPRGVESAERILFILEKKNDNDAVMAEARAFLNNSALMQTGGEEFKKRLIDINERASFKKIEAMPEGEKSEQAAKGRAYLVLSQKVQGDLREKALNNAAVFADKGGDAASARQARSALLREFPKSSMARNLQLRQGEDAAREGNWAEALNSYKAFMALETKPTGDREKALWNTIYIQSHLEDVYTPRFRQSRNPSAALTKLLNEYVSDFPRAARRDDALAVLVFRADANLNDVARYRKLPALNSDSRAVLTEAEIVITSRKGSLKDLEGLTKYNAPQSANTRLKKNALGSAAFKVTEQKFKEYERAKLNYNPKRFANTLQIKLDALKKLDKDYMRVVSYGDPESALQSLERLSRLYLTLASDIEKAPVDKKELEPFTKPLRDKGEKFLFTCIDKAVELKIGGNGVSACRRGLSTIKPEAAALADAAIPEPQWLPTGLGNDLRPMIVGAASSFQEGRLGEFALAHGLLSEKAEPPLSDLENVVMENMQGLWSWRMQQGDEAVKSFTKAFGSRNASVRSAAAKNLAALYLQIGDYNQAQEALRRAEGNGAEELENLLRRAKRGKE